MNLDNDGVAFTDASCLGVTPHAAACSLRATAGVEAAACSLAAVRAA